VKKDIVALAAGRVKGNWREKMLKKKVLGTIWNDLENHLPFFAGRDGPGAAPEMLVTVGDSGSTWQLEL
jgi:hypothetical protein